MAILGGALIALAVGLFATAVGLDRDRAFYPAVTLLTGEGVDVVFESIGGAHIWRSRKALRPGGTVVAYGSLVRSVRGDWLVVPVVVIAFELSPFSGSILSPA